MGDVRGLHGRGFERPLHQAETTTEQPGPGSASALPSGTITFFFSDIEASTALWEEHPDLMKDAVALHDDVIKSGITSHGGHVFSTAGDGFAAAFRRPEEALAAAVEVQCALTSQPWTRGCEVRTRIGIHSGTADERGGDYFGRAVNRAARLMDAGHGGQVLVSLATEELVRDHLPQGVTLQDLGEHRLRNLHRPERLFQVEVPGLPSQFPPLRILDAVPNNLPAQLSSFVGRERELAQVADLLESHRLVTLTGVGGTGKTRLALEYAAQALERFPDGVHFVELATVVDPSLVAERIATAVSVPSAQGGARDARSDVERLAACLREERMLLVLDNCEHVIEATARVAEQLLLECTQVCVLATSREVLGVAGEQAVRVPSLGVPPDTRELSAEELLAYESSRLLVERARGADPDFQVSAEDATAVAEICRRLDGIPLALELAAACMVSLSPGEVVKRLENQFRLLTGGRRTAVERHQTLRAAIDWSYELLGEDARILLARLGVFSGGWTLDAAEAVGAGDRLEAPAVLDALSELVDKSMVAADRRDGGTRYRMGEPMRQYALERLAASGDTEVLRDRHAAWIEDRLALTSYSDFAVRSNDLERLLLGVTEYANVAEAARWLLERGDADTAGRVAVGMYLAVLATGQHREGLRLADAVLAHDDVQGWVRYLAQAISGLFTFYLGDFGGARNRVEEAAAVGMACPEVPSLYASCFVGATIATTTGGMTNLRDQVVVARAEAAAEGNEYLAHFADYALAFAAMEDGDDEDAIALLGKAFEPVKDFPVGFVPYAQAFMAYYKVMAGHDDAEQMVEDAEEVTRDAGDPMAIAWALVARMAAGPGERSRAAFAETFRLIRRYGLGMWVCLEAGALDAEHRDDAAGLARVLGALSAHIGNVPAVARWERRQVWAQERLGEARFRAEYDTGAQAGAEAVVEAMLDPTSSPGTRRPLLFSREKPAWETGELRENR